MRLLHLDVGGFAQLRGRVDLEAGAGKVGLLIAPNEAGKSTLVAALRAALYGLDDDRRRARGRATERERYRPWTGEEFRLALTLEHAGEVLVVQRDLAHDEVRVFSGADDVTDRFRDGARVAVGETLTGLSAAQFATSLHVAQGELGRHAAEGLSDALQRVADRADGGPSARRAVAALEASLQNYDGLTLARPGRVETEIDRCRAAIDEARAALDRLRAQRADFESRVVAIQAGEDAERADDDERQRLRAARTRTELAAVEAVLSDDDGLAARIDEEVRALDDHAAGDAELAACRQRLVVLEQRHDRACEEVERRRRGLADAGAAEDAAAASLAELRLHGALDDEARPALASAVEALRATATAHEALLERLSAEERRLQGTGVEGSRALALLERFDGLDADTRGWLAGRLPREGARDDRRREAGSREAHATRILTSLVSDRDGARRRALVVMAVAVLAAVAVLVFGDRILVPAPALIGVPALLAAWGLIESVRAPRLHHAVETDARATLEAAAAEHEACDDEAAEEERFATSLAASLGLEAATLDSEFAAWQKVAGAGRAVRDLRDEVEQAHAHRLEALSALAAFENVFGESATEIRVATWPERAARGVERSERLRQTAAMRAVAEDALAEAEAEVAAIEDAVLGELRAFADEDDPRAAFTAQVDAAREREERRVHGLDALRGRRLETERRAAHEARRDALRQQLDSLPDTDDGPLDATAYEEALAALDERAATRRAANEVTRIEVRGFLAEYEERAPRLEAELEEHQTALRRATEYREAITLARDTLARLAAANDAHWVTGLREETLAFLRAMQSAVDDLEFDGALRLRLHTGGRWFTDDEAPRVLSAGALDTVHLAARLAIGRRLSGGGETLPLILDDPFADVDDERLAAGLRALVDAVAPHQQVLLMACQPSRYDWARRRLDRDDVLVALRLSYPVDAA